MIRKLIYRIFIIGFACALSSCDNFIHINGYVIDPAINEPVADAHVYLVFKSGFFHTSIKKVDDLAEQIDMISEAERKEYIRTHGNKDGWISFNPEGKIQNEKDRMVRHIPLKTDFYGSFEILLSAGRNYTLIIEKNGYETLAIERKDLDKYQTLSIFTFKLKKKSGT